MREGSGFVEGRPGLEAMVLGVVAESLVDAGHTNEDDPEMGAVVVSRRSSSAVGVRRSASSMMSSSTSLVMPFMMRGVVSVEVAIEQEAIRAWER
jgi:hypothetical protein